MSGLLTPFYSKTTVPGAAYFEYAYKGGESKVKEAAAAILAYLAQNGFAGPSDIEAKVRQCPYIVLTENGVEFRSSSSRKRKEIEDPQEVPLQALEALNPQQRRAVERVDGRTMVLAGPGSGKTRMIVARILFLIEQGVQPEKILAVTFTKKAAREMQERLAERVKGVTIKTFHSLGMQILRRFAPEVGRKHNFRIFDEKKSIPIIAKAIIYCRSVRGWNDHPQVKSLNAKDVYHMVEFAKSNQGRFAAHIDGIVKTLLEDVASRYDEALEKENALDFADLLAKTHELFTKHKEALKYFQGVWSHLHVDEYQDTNPLQSGIAEFLAAKCGNLFVVGDRKQSIYAWRGACPEVVDNFQREGTGVIALAHNYRCPQTILDVAARLMDGTPMAEEARQECATDSEGNVFVHSFANCEEEATFVIGKVKEMLQEGIKGGDIAVLVRTNTQIERFRDRCDELGVDYFVRENADSDEMAFFNEPEVKAARAFLQTVADPKDVQSFIQAASAMKILPPKDLSKLEVQLGNLPSEATIVSFCQEFLRKPKSVPGFSLPKSSRERLGPFVERVAVLIGRVPLQDAAQSLSRVVEGVGYLPYLQKTLPKKHAEKKALIEQLVDKAKGQSVESFLRPEGARLHIITLHCAKGLEFDTVFMVGMEEGIFPHFNAAEDGSIEEERRLCYVGITRSKKELYFTHASRRYKSAIEQYEDMPPSRFLQAVQ